MNASKEMKKRLVCPEGRRLARALQKEAWIAPFFQLTPTFDRVLTRLGYELLVYELMERMETPKERAVRLRRREVQLEKQRATYAPKGEEKRVQARPKRRREREAA